MNGDVEITAGLQFSLPVINGGALNTQGIKGGNCSLLVIQQTARRQVDAAPLRRAYLPVTISKIFSLELDIAAGDDIPLRVIHPMARSELNVALRRADFSAMVGKIVGVKLDIAICGKNAFAVIQPSFSAHGQVALRRNHLPLLVPKAGHL
ncbi:Uncharacterised protein [Klebsiella aerogenes]|nr:Uncharacterised protein [Klebsiella aerogenes]